VWQKYPTIKAYVDTLNAERIDLNVVNPSTSTYADYDGNIYTTIIIGNQEWMIENLRTTHYNDGTEILNLVDIGDWAIDTNGAYCWYNNNITYKTPYGALYNWNVVNNIHGLAPIGWRIPTLSDFNTLISSIGGNTIAGGKLKESGLIHWNTPNTDATNEYGFVALPGGERSDAAFDNLGDMSGIWTSTNWGIDSGYMCQLSKSSGSATMSVWFQLYGLSVRCMRDYSNILIPTDVCTLVYQNSEPIFDVPIPLQGLTLENDGSDYYINVPSMTYFQDLPVNIAKFYNLTERITKISNVNITIDPDYESFYAKDYVKLVKLDKRKNLFISESSSYIISGTSPNFVLDVSPSGFEIDSSTEWYIINDTSRLVSQFNISNLTSTTCLCDISSYTFRINQVIDIIVQDISTGYTSGAAYRVISVDSFDASRGYPHTFSGNFPNCFAADPSKYSLAAKHAFTSFANFEIDIKNSIEADANFRIYLDDTYYHQYCLDNTFVFQDIPFNQDIVRENWYDPSIITPFITMTYYPFKYSITLDPSTIVILRSVYDPSLYMLNQKNIWEIKEHDSSDLLMRVYNEVVPYIFTNEGDFDINVKSFDSFGNLKEQDFEGLIKIVDNG